MLSVIFLLKALTKTRSIGVEGTSRCVFLPTDLGKKASCIS